MRVAGLLLATLLAGSAHAEGDPRELVLRPVTLPSGAVEAGLALALRRADATEVVATPQLAVGTPAGEVAARASLAFDGSGHGFAAAWRVPLARDVAVRAELGRDAWLRFADALDEPVLAASLDLAYVWRHANSAVELGVLVDTRSTIAAMVTVRAQLVPALAVEAQLATAYVLEDRHPVGDAGLRAVVALAPSLDLVAGVSVRALDPASQVASVGAVVRRLP